MVTLRIGNRGSGGFLCPPLHPCHTQNVTEYERGRENGFYCLENVLEYKHLAPIHKEVKAILDKWENEKLPLDDELVVDWILHVLGYFKDCWKNTDLSEPMCWRVDKLRIGKRLKDQPYTEHAGVHLIHKYYPDFMPLAIHFECAYWGKKP